MFSSTIKKLPAIILFIILAQVLQGQEKDSILIVDAKGEVPALSEFHSVIYPLWHTAWPEKSTKMLVELLPEIERLSADVFTATLPGILREKQTAWENGIKELKSAIQEYKSATAPVDTQKLLDAAEKLHGQYEKLVRVIRPALKELDAFHSVLYVLYHYYLPEWRPEKIKVSVTELRQKMNMLNNAQLSKRQESKKESFAAARAKLDTTLKELEDVVTSNEKILITDKINAMHMQYVAVDEVFN